MKKLIIISYDFPPQDGGIARLCQEISVGQQRYFNEVTVLTTNKEGESYTYNFETINRIEFTKERIKCEREIIKYLKKISNKNEYVVLTATWHPEGLLAYLAGFKNFYILAHGTELLSGISFFRKNIWLPIYSKLLLKKAKGIIANSKYTKTLVQNIQPKSNVVALPLAVNENFFKPIENKIRSNKFKICSVSRIEKFKGHDIIACVLANLPINVKEKIHWNIAGKGPDLKYVQDLVKKLDLCKFVTFNGFIPDDELPMFYAQSDIFILCSRESKSSIEVEGFGLVFLEAQSCGIPVIGTNTGGIPDAIEHGNGGFLIEQDNEQQLTEILLNLVNTPSLLEEQKLRARNRVLNGFTWNHYNEKLFNILNK